MLIEFSVENFKSIKDKITLSMLASSIDEHSEQLISTPALKNDKLLRCAAIFGANAAGKSNILYAFQHLAALVVLSHKRQLGDKIPIVPFLLSDEAQTKPTRFEVSFVSDGVKYKYILALTNAAIVEERLFSYENHREASIFERHGQDYKFNRDEGRQKDIAQKTLENILYLSKATQENYEPTKSVFKWFLLTVPPGFIDIRDISSVRIDNALNLPLDEYKPGMLKMLNSIDIDVAGISVKKINMANNEKKESFIVKFLHQYEGANQENKTVAFPLGYESAGTLALFNLCKPIMDVLQRNTALFVDELDASMHPLAQEYVVKSFLTPESPESTGQLIFTTHNTNLLDLDLLRRDQIWFAEKRPDRSTDLYCMTDLDPMPRLEDNIRKKYLVGKYGAIPFISGGKF